MKSILCRLGIAVLLSLSLIFSAPGCATIIRGNQQNVTIVTKPAGQVVEYQGMRLKDGDTFTLQKHYDPARFAVDSNGRQIMVDVQYEADPLVIADAALLLFFIVPGLVALGVDFGTGAWRNYSSPQVVYISVGDSEETSTAAPSSR
ncbi:MAG: hypothetical protein ABIK28_00830 [Planctomycetota bacterium]